MYYKLAQLVLTPGRRSQTVSEIFLAQPDSIKESLAGKLFILIELEQNNSDSLKIINFLIDNINNNYYQNEKIYLREKISSLKVEHIFEASLAKTNKNLLEYFDKEKIKIDPRTINVTVGVLHENMIHFANIGKNKTFLIYKGGVSLKTTQNGNNEEYKIINIAEEDKSSKNKVDFQSGKFFSNVVSGQIPEKGIFLFANEALPEYISSKQLIQVVTTLPPLSAVEQIKSMLTRINSYVSFLGIIIKSTTIEKIEEKREPTNATTQESINALNHTEESTESLLTPTGIVDSKKFINRLSSILRKKNKIGEKNAQLKDKIFVKKKHFVLLDKIWQKIKNILILSANFIFFIFKSFTSKDKLNELAAQSKEKTTSTYANLKTSLLSLTQKRKMLLIIFIVCLLVFGASLARSSYKSKIEKVRQDYDNLIAQIEQKQNQTDAYILYNNEEGTRKTLNEITELLKNFPQNTDEQKDKYKEISDKINGQLAEVRKIKKISVDPIIDFINLNSNAKPQNLAYSPETNRIYVGDSDQKSIYIFDIEKNLATTLTGFSQTISTLLFPMLTKDKQIYYLNNDNLIKFDTSKEEIDNIKIVLKTEAQNIAGANIYNNKIYLLSPKENQIFKYDKVGNSFSSPQNWLEENVDLNNSVDLAIDGNIYILKTDGSITKMLKGKTVEFNMQTVDPNIEKATKLLMAPEQKYIYILEPSQKRLVVYDKDGKFLLQYQSEQWQDLRDVVVDEKNKTIYLLNGTFIIKFPLQH